MRTLLIAMVLIAFCATNSNAAPVEWQRELEVDDFDDSKAFISFMMVSDQGTVSVFGVRYDESVHSEYFSYNVGWSPNLLEDAFTTCGDTGSRAEHSGWSNIQVRVDGGKVMSFTGEAFNKNQSVALQDGTEDNVATLIQSLIGAKKVVIRTKDKCYKEGKDWLFSKFEEIAGQHYLKRIKL